MHHINGSACVHLSADANAQKIAFQRKKNERNRTFGIEATEKREYMWFIRQQLCDRSDSHEIMNNSTWKYCIHAYMYLYPCKYIDLPSRYYRHLRMGKHNRYFIYTYKNKTQHFSHAFLMKLNYSYCQFLLKTIVFSGKFLKNNEFHRFKFSTFSKSIFQPKKHIEEMSTGFDSYGIILALQFEINKVM